jgi:hypothetical protein
MAVLLVEAVFASALAAWLKPFAAAYATFAANDGTRVYPSIERIAQMTSRSRRQTLRATAELRALHILIELERSKRHGPTRYLFVPDALPRLTDGRQLRIRFAQDELKKQRAG